MQNRYKTLVTTRFVSILMNGLFIITEPTLKPISIQPFNFLTNKYRYFVGYPINFTQNLALKLYDIFEQN